MLKNLSRESFTPHLSSEFRAGSDLEAYDAVFNSLRPRGRE